MKCRSGLKNLSRIAHLEHQVEQLNEVVTGQGKLVEFLQTGATPVGVLETWSWIASTNPQTAAPRVTRSFLDATLNCREFCR